MVRQDYEKSAPVVFHCAECGRQIRERSVAIGPRGAALVICFICIEGARKMIGNPYVA